MSKSSSIPEALIEIEARKIWKKRLRKGIDGTPEDDWREAKEYLEKHRWKVFWWEVRHPQSRDFALKMIESLGISLTALGLLFTFWEGLQDRRLTQERLITERFSKAVEQLGKYKDGEGETPDVTVRTGGIYALERIAKDSPKDHWTIMEVLTAYVRENAPLPPELKQIPEDEQELEQRWKKLAKLTETEVSIDVQAVLTVIGRREDTEPNIYETIAQHIKIDGGRRKDPEPNIYEYVYEKIAQAVLTVIEQRENPESNIDETIDLSATNLSNADLRDANLQSARLLSANLQSARLLSANLQSARLLSANLHDAFLYTANLQSARLVLANLQSARLVLANLHDAFLYTANLQEADLRGANLQKANLYTANLQSAFLEDAKNLTPQQIKSACNWEKAIYKGEWDWYKRRAKAIEPDNTNYIKALKQNKASNPKEPPDCSRWSQ